MGATAVWGIPLIDAGATINSLRGFFNPIANALETALTNALSPATPILPNGDTPGMIPAGTAAQRDTYWGVPATAAERLALASKGARWFNTQTGIEEQYFGLWSDSTTKTFLAKAAGWYKNRARELPLPAPNTNGASSDIVTLGAPFQLNTATSAPRLFMRDGIIYGSFRINKTSAMGHADVMLTFASGYRPIGNAVGGGIASGPNAAQITGYSIDSATGALKPLSPPPSTSLEVHFNFPTIVGA